MLVEIFMRILITVRGRLTSESCGTLMSRSRSVAHHSLGNEIERGGKWRMKDVAGTWDIRRKLSLGPTRSGDRGNGRRRMQNSAQRSFLVESGLATLRAVTGCVMLVHWSLLFCSLTVFDLICFNGFTAVEMVFRGNVDRFSCYLSIVYLLAFCL